MLSARHRTDSSSFSKKIVFPEGAEEGSWLVIHDDGTVEIDEEKTIRRRLANMYRMKNMLKRKY